MTNLKRELGEYFREALAVEVECELWQPARRLPLYLRDGYVFYQAEILGNRCLLMADKGDDAQPPVTLRKHFRAVEAKWDGDFIVYVREQITGNQRGRLIQQRIPFVVPGSQMYLPMLGIDLREHYRKLERARAALKPATQAVLLCFLNGCAPEEATPSQLAERLQYTKMTMTRAVDELETHDLFEVTKTGRERVLRLKETRKQLWENALPLLQSPVTQEKQLQGKEHRQAGPAAGLTALAAHSMLAAPGTPVIAVSPETWKNLVNVVTNAEEQDALVVQAWRYDPRLFARDDVVDRFSLFLSLRENQDERVEAALAEMMEGIEW